tara:strand:- start:5 stop:652 length:648 start_codon:yes stop_codon:yes gene_type:complete
MSEIRIEKKFVYQEGDESYKYFLINSMIKKIYLKRTINSVYFDTDEFKSVWDNINGFGDRLKIRLRWYNNLDHSDVFLEEKIKKNFTTIKKVVKLGNFKNYPNLENFLTKKLKANNLFLKKKINLKKILYVSYDREYFIHDSKKLRFTLDKNIKVFLNYAKKPINIDKNILEIKYDPKYSTFCNKFLIENKLKNRNQKFSKYVNSFLELNESGLI